MDATGNKVFDQDDQSWENYSRGRPQVPDAFFDRIFAYHEGKGGQFGTVHDVGAGNGPYAKRLRARFAHVIVSDIVPTNVQLAQKRLRGLDGFAFRAAKLEEADDIPAGSVDMVFATNVMHFPDPQDAAMAVALWTRISQQGGRSLLQTVDDPETTAKIMARTGGVNNVAPLRPDLFLPGALRVHLNMAHGGLEGPLPPEAAHLDTESSFTGLDDVEVFEEEAGWDFETDLEGVKAHFASFPFVSKFPDAFTELYKELDQLLADGRRVKGYFPAKIILATRR
ncbi:S-adenosyl-L-methionine-dependent methyltransferase [Apiospora arundinis]